MDFDWMNFAAMNFAHNFPQAEMRLCHMDVLINNFNRMLGPFRAAWVMSQFSQLRNLDEKFAFIWKLPEAYQCLISPLPKTTRPLKDEDAAERLKTEGNILYKQKQLDTALKCYTGAIVLASHPELSISPMSTSSCGNEKDQVKLSSNASDLTKYKTLAISYANRAAVLLEMKKYDKCLRDIELALESGYPELLQSKLLERKKKCLGAQRQENAGGERVERELPVLADPNKTIPSFSSDVKLAYSKEKGRHVVAVKDIHPGDVIAVEESPFIFININHQTDCCPVCSRISDAPLPCPGCCVGFCSETCRTIGLRDYHCKECKVFPTLVVLGLGMTAYAEIALKVLLRTPIAEMKEKFDVLQKEAKELSPEKLGFDSEGIYSSADFRTVFHMPARLHMNSEQHTFKMCLIAVVLTKLLCEVEGVSSDTHNLPANIFQDIVTKGTVILHLLVNRPILMDLQATKLPIMMDLQATKVDTQLYGVLSQRMGSGIFPSIVLMNHSCSAPALTYNIGPVMIVRAIRSIPTGNEVTVAFGPRFETDSKIVRKQRLQTRDINCSCEACVKDWPLINDQPFVEFLCIKCSETLTENKCNKCQINYEKPDYEGEKKATVEQWRFRFYQFKQAEEKFHHAAQKLDTRQPVTKADFDDICKFVVMLENNVKFPSQIYFHVTAVMAKYCQKF